jgi:gliding motility-associated-like protein
LNELKHTTLILLSFVFLRILGSAQNVTPTKGKDFWLGFMKNYETESGESLDLFIVSDQNTSGVIEIPGQSWSQSFTVTANITTTVTIPNNVGEMYTFNQIQGRGIHVTTEDTVAVFAINFNPYTADAAKILPTPTLGIDYMAASYVGIGGYESEMLIVATADDSEIEITPSTDLEGGYAAGLPFVVQLNQGECIQYRTLTGGDLTGTRITGTAANGNCRPFAVFSGTDCTNLPTECGACDHIFDQNFPISLWGTEYFLTPWSFISSIGGGYTWRVMASVDNTTVTVDGGGAFTLNAGEYQEFNHDADPHCVNADQPIAVIQYMEGITCGGDGDPAMVVVDDVNKKIDQITFSTVESAVINDHYLNLVINAEQLGNVALDGAIVDPALFESFPNCNDQMWCAVPITEGSHLLEAPGGGVTAYVYGYGDAESYAYSVGSFSPVPPILIDEAICTSDGVTLQISANLFDPIWFNYNEPETILHEGYVWELPLPIQNGIYVGQGNELASGCESPFYFSVEVPEPPVFSISPDQVICRYESVQLQMNAQPENAVYTYNWTPTAGLSNPSIANPVATPLQSTTYTCTITTPSGCASAEGTVDITVQNGDITSFEITPDEVMYCTGGSEELSVTAEAEIWSDDFDPGIAWGSWEDITNGAADDVCGAVNDQALYFNGTTTREAITNGLNVTSGGSVYFSLKIANGTAPCEDADPGDNVVLSYSVSNGPWVVINTYYEAAYPNFTSIEVPIPAGAYSTNTRFRWHQTGLWLNNQDNWALDNVYIGTIQTNSYSYTWSPAAGLDFTSQPVVNASPTETTTYYAELIDQVLGCSYIDSVLVNVGQGFTLDMPNDTVLCDADGIQLYAIPSVDGDFDYAWSPSTNISNAFGATPTVSPTTNVTYSVDVTSEQGCSASGEVTIEVAVLLDLTLNSSDDNICAGQTVTLNAVIPGNPPGITISWTPAASLTNPAAASTTANPTATTTYECSVSYQDMCGLTEEITIDVQPAFTIEASPDDVTSCVIEGLPVSAVADVNSQLTWQWTPANLVANPNVPATTVSQDTSTDLIVVATNSAGCSARDTVFLQQLFEFIDLPESIAVCEDELVVLDCGHPATHTIVWTNGLTTPSIEVTASGTYGVVATSPDGCVSQDECDVLIYTYPPLPALEDTAVCATSIVELNAGVGDYNYLWNTGDEGPMISVSEPGNYVVTIDNEFCFTTVGMTLDVYPLPVNPFGESPITSCLSYPPYGVALNANNPNAFYLWNTGAMSQEIVASTEGVYLVTVTTPFGCESTFSQSVESVCPGSIYVPNGFTPNGDGTNDYWSVSGNNIEQLEVWIYNRWGEVFYQSDDIDFKWMGQRRDGEFFVEPGTYSYLIKVQLRDEKGRVEDEQEIRGFVTLVR